MLYQCLILRTWNELELPGMGWNHFKWTWTTWNKLEPYEMSRNCLEQAGNTWNKVEPHVTRRTLQQTDTHTKKEIYKRNWACNNHCPIEYNISNSYCHKEHHLMYLQVEPPGTEWNQQLDDTKKTLIGQYCVYNVISLQNITLQIPIATKSSILDVNKEGVPDPALVYIHNFIYEAKHSKS